MKRLHVHIAVKDLESSIRFYSSLFNAEPTIAKSDYAKWMLDDPRVNFAISNRGDKTGLDHLGIQVESDNELDEVKTWMQDAELPVRTEENTACCYSRSNKHWTTDPSGIAWETFHSMEALELFGGGSEKAASDASACCLPKSSVHNAGSSGCC